MRGADATIRMPRCRRAGAALAATLLLAPCCASAAASEQPTQAEVMAAFLYKFAHFVEWPEAAFPPGAALVLGVVGPDPFGEVLDRTVAGKTVRGRPIQLRRFPSATSASAEVAGCHILFISPELPVPAGEIIAQLAGAPTLTISESDHFAAEGGMINFVYDENRVRFQINPEASRRAGLLLSSQLLTLAQIVDGPPPPGTR